MIELDQRFQISEDVIAREVAGEMVLLDLASGLYFGLNPVGSRIWSRLSEGVCSITEICDVIEHEFDASRDQIEGDVVALLRQLSGKDLICQVA